MEDNCLICYDKCRPDFNTYLTQNPDLKADVCNLVCEIYKLPNKNSILDLKNYFNFCQLCFDDLARVDRAFKSLKRLQESLKRDREELDNRIRESHKRFRILPAKNRVINSVRDEIIRNIAIPKNVQNPSESYGLATNTNEDEPEGIVISNEISQDEDPFQSLDECDYSSPILGDVEEELEIPEVKFSLIDDNESTPIPLKSHTKLKKAILILPKLPESIQEHPNPISINDPSIQAFVSRLPYLKQQNTIRPKPTFKCFFCPMLFNHRGLVIQHKKKDHKDELYSCSEGFCSAQFSTHQGLMIHQRGVHNIHEYECYFCPEILASPKELLSHKKIQHPNTIFVCPISSCAREFAKKDTFDNHIKVKHGGDSSEPKLPCTEGCGKIFITKFQLTTHLKAHRETEQTYPCPFEGCDKIFAARAGRRYHYKNFHKSTLEDLNLQLLLKYGEGTRITDSNNRKKPSTPRVRRVHKPHKNAIVEKVVKPKAIKSKILSKPRKQKKVKGENQIGSWLCEFCSKIFTNRQHLNSHLKHQHPPGGKTSYQCTECPKSFFYKNSLKDHINQIHLKNFNHYCDQCGLGYYSLPRLNDHRRMHFLTIPCRICPRKFAFTFNRNKHELSHSSEKTFKCSQCPASFKRAISIKNHNITQHSDAEPFVCEKCGQKFKLRCNLRRHIILKRCKGK